MALDDEVVVFPMRLRMERKRLKLTLEDFGNLGGVSKSSQWLYEKAKNWPTLEYLESLRKNGVDVGFIATGVRSSSKQIDWLILKNSFMLVQHSFVDTDVEYSPEQLFDAFKTVAEAALGISRPDLVSERVSIKRLVNDNEPSG